jgi:hypothetical protein
MRQGCSESWTLARKLLHYSVTQEEIKPLPFSPKSRAIFFAQDCAWFLRVFPSGGEISEAVRHAS